MTSNDTRAMTYSAAGIYAGAALIGAVESLLPGGEAMPLAPAVAACAIALVVALVGQRLPIAVLALLGPLGAALIAVAIAGSQGPTDGAVLYVWSALWMAVFFGNRGAVFIVLWTGLVHLIALISLPAGDVSVDRWIDVEAAVIVVVIVVRMLVARSDRLMRTLADEARVDPLTSLLNRRGLDERVELELARTARTGASLAVVVFDIDRFKRINDEHGHEVGDRILAWVGETLASEARGVDIAARLGGEEFVVLLPDTDLDDARAFAERVRRRLNAPGTHPAWPARGISQRVHVTVSGGVAVSEMPPDVARLLAAADRALYRAKRDGRDRIAASGVDVAVPAAHAARHPTREGV